MSLSPGERIGFYEVIAPLGAGAMGEVYRVRDVRLGRDVAVKVLPDDLAGDPERLARFEREARTLAALNHPNIVTIHSVESHGNRRLLTMEWVEGQTLDRLIPPGGMALAEFFAVAAPLADALAAAHERGITHRDLKPANVIVRPDGRLVVLDFGLARRAADLTPAPDAGTVPALTSTGVILGTPRYMSPEQAKGRPADARSDIFSLGAVYYELLSGQRPFGGATVSDVLAAVLRDTPVPLPSRRPDVPEPLWRLIRRCLEKDPRRRVQSALDVRNELEELRAEQTAPPAAAAAATAPRSIRADGIAVLPLANLSGQASEEFFADGMTEALITDLAKVGGLKVISRGSVMSYRGSTRPLAEIGRELGVTRIVEGSVLRAGDRVRISARLVQSDTDECLWAERYDRDLADVLTLQDEVARAIANAVDATLRGATPAAPRRVDPEVYLLDLRGRHLWHQRTEAAFRAALGLFEEAIRRDPTYAPAYVGMADSLNMLSNFGFVPPQDILPRASAAVRHALDLDPQSAEAHRVLAFVHWQFEFNWNGALAEYERALEIDPNSAVTIYWFGMFLAVIGWYPRSYRMLERAQQLDPLSLLIPSAQGWVRFFARRFTDALPFYEHVLRIDPNFYFALWFQGQTLTELGRYDEGIAALTRAYELGGRPARLLGYLGYAYGRAGRTDQARAILGELDARAHTAYMPPYFPALVHAGLEDADRAIDLLEEAYRIRDTMLRDLQVDPHWDRFHGTPRFDALMRRMAYPPPEP